MLSILCDYTGYGLICKFDKLENQEDCALLSPTSQHL